MEHIVQFAVGIDDEAIKKRVEESGYDDVIKGLMLEAKKGLVNTPYARTEWGRIEIKWDRVLEDNIKAFMAKNQDVIIEKAAEKLCESYKRTKKFKEAAAKVLEG